VFADPVRAAELLQSALPRAIARAVQWDSLCRVDATFVDDDLRDQQADLLFTAQSRGRPVLLYVLLEHKSGADRRTTRQLLGYVLRIWDAWEAEHAAGALLPPVVPFVVHHGPRPWHAPRHLHELIDLADLPPELAAIQPAFAFVLDDLAASDQADLQQRRLGIQSLLVLLHLQQLRRHAATAALLLAWRHLHLRLLAQPGGQAILDRLVSYVAAVSDDERQQLTDAYRRIHATTGREFMTVADRLREEGRLEGRIETLLTMLEQRFGPVPPNITARIRTADAPTVDRWTNRVLIAPTLEELLA